MIPNIKNLLILSLFLEGIFIIVGWAMPTKRNIVDYFLTRYCHSRRKTRHK